MVRNAAASPDRHDRRISFAKEQEPVGSSAAPKPRIGSSVTLATRACFRFVCQTFV